jgi:hypothetical protein
VGWIDYTALAIIAIANLTALYNLFYVASMRIVVEERQVTFRQGILPWRIQAWSWADWQIFQAAYLTGKFFDWLLRRATILIYDREGTTETFRIPYVGRGRQCVAEINDVARRSPSRNLAPPA